MFTTTSISRRGTDVLQGTNCVSAEIKKQLTPIESQINAFCSLQVNCSVMLGLRRRPLAILYTRNQLMLLKAFLQCLEKRYENNPILPVDFFGSRPRADIWHLPAGAEEGIL